MTQASIIAAGALAVLLLAWFVAKAVIGHLIAAYVVRTVARRKKHEDRSPD